MARLIGGPRKKEVPVVIAKRVVKTKSQKAKKSELSQDKTIDEAVSRIESKVKAEKKDPIEQAISKLESRVKGAAGKEFIGNLAGTGIPFRMYKMEVENRIKSNWAYPVALLGPKSEKDLEAILVVRVRNNGTILKSWFQKRSSSVIFDLSVLKAVERSDPLPPFPEGYRKTYDEMEINFNLRDLEKH
jgi:colicin import membrane protein